MESQTLNRPSREATYLAIADLIAKRGTCGRAQVGAVIVKGKRIISTGYNGPLPNENHCSPQICDTSKTCSRAIHAELNAILVAAKEGIALEGSTLYCTYAPCEACAKAIVMAGIKKVFYRNQYKDHLGLWILKQHDIEAIQFI